MQYTRSHPWLKKVYHWFDAHPEREFRLARVPRAALPAISKAGSFVGCGTSACKPKKRVTPYVRSGDAQIPCIIRRADPAGGRPKLGVYLIDGAAPPPRSPSAGEEERFCETIWSLAQIAEQAGVSLVTLMLNPAMLARAASQSLPVRANKP